MSDPFDNLFGDDPPVTVRRDFAEQLRSRLQQELGPLGDEDPVDVDQDSVDSADVDQDGAESGLEPINVGSLFYFTLPCADIDRSAAFYGELFDWELHRGDQGYHVANVYPPMGLERSDTSRPSVWIEVEDINAAVARVRSLGGRAEEPEHYDSGWSAECRDPQGVRFLLQVPAGRYRQPARRSTVAGELFYWALPAPEAGRSKQFYGQLFGWEFGTRGNQGGMHVENRLPDGGLGGGRDGEDPELFFRVTDLDQAMATVVRLGGSAQPAGEGPEGRHAMCTDDQGVRFGLSQPSDEY